MDYSLELCNSDKLTGLVTHYFCFSITEESREERKLMPSGRQYILFIPRGEVTFTFKNNKKLLCNKVAVVGGVSDYSFSYHAKPGTAVLGVSMVTNGLFKLFGRDLREMATPNVESREFLNSNELQEVLEKLTLVEGLKAQYDIIESYLLSKTGVLSESAIDEVIQSINDAKGDIKLSQLASKVHVSEDYLHNEFARETGIAPEKYIHLIRFKYAFTEFVNGDLDPGEMAQQYNYENHSRLLLDFKQYTGLSPKNVEIDDFTSYNAYRQELKRLGIQFLI